MSGTDGRDNIRAGSSGATKRINVDAGERAGDADLTLSPNFDDFSVFAGSGPDVIDLRGGAGTGDMFAGNRGFFYGGPGGDVIAAGCMWGDLTAGSGNDWVSAGPSRDDVELGAGDDRLTGLNAGGPDRINFIVVGATVDFALTTPQRTGGGMDTFGGGKSSGSRERADRTSSAAPPAPSTWAATAATTCWTGAAARTTSGAVATRTR